MSGTERDEGGWAVIVAATGSPVWPGRWSTEDGAKQMLRRFQRDLNRNGYNPESERLSVAFMPDGPQP